MKNTEKKKICLLITQGELGGAQVYLRDIATHLDQDKFDITIAHGEKPDAWLSNEAKKNDINFKFLNFVIRAINPFIDLIGFFQLYLFFIKNKFDIVHLNSSKIGIIGSVAAKFAGARKVIFTCHGWAFDDPRPFWERKAYIFAYKIMSYFTDKIITVSEYAKDAGIKHGLPEKKLTTIHNAPDLERIDLMREGEAREKLKNELNIPIEKKLIGTVANFYPTKGIVYLLKAAKIAIKNNKDLVFCIIGKGKLKFEFEKFIANNDLENNIFLISPINNAATILPAFDLYVLPSLKECLPYVLFEAINAGLPIVATNVGGVPEVLNYYDKDFYKLVEAKNPKNLADAILKMIDKQKFSEDKLIEIRKKISINNMIEKTNSTYFS